MATEFRYTIPKGAVPVREALGNIRPYDRFFRDQMGVSSVKVVEGETIVSFPGVARVDNVKKEFGITTMWKDESPGLSLRRRRVGDGQEIVELLGMPNEGPVDVTDATISLISQNDSGAGKTVFKFPPVEDQFLTNRDLSIQAANGTDSVLHTHVANNVVVES